MRMCPDIAQLRHFGRMHLSGSDVSGQKYQIGQCMIVIHRAVLLIRLVIEI